MSRASVIFSCGVYFFNFDYILQQINFHGVESHSSLQPSSLSPSMLSGPSDQFLTSSGHPEKEFEMLHSHFDTPHQSFIYHIQKKSSVFHIG